LPFLPISNLPRKKPKFQPERPKPLRSWNFISAMNGAVRDAIDRQTERK
jgi:hypothetical protein